MDIRTRQQKSTANGGKPQNQFEWFDNIPINRAPAYRIKGILPHSGLFVVWGPKKCGKSFWVFDLSMHIAIGREYRGHKVRQGTVIYLALEGGSGFANRIAAWRERYLTEYERQVPFCLRSASLNLIADINNLIADIHTEIGNDPPAIIVIDTLNRALVGDENDSKDMSMFIRAADRLHAEFGCLIIIIHHCGYAKNHPRGHTSLSAAAEGQIRVERDEDTGIVRATVEFMKDGEAGAVLASKLEKVDLGTDNEGDPISSLVVVPQADNTEKIMKLKGDPLIAFEVLERLLRSSIDSIPAPEEAEFPDGTRVCRQAKWREFFCDGCDDKTPAAAGKAFKRALTKLLELKLIEPWREYVTLRPAEQPDKPDKTDKSGQT